MISVLRFWQEAPAEGDADTELILFCRRHFALEDSLVVTRSVECLK